MFFSRVFYARSALQTKIRVHFSIFKHTFLGRYLDSPQDMLHTPSEEIFGCLEIQSCIHEKNTGSESRWLATPKFGGEK